MIKIYINKGFTLIELSIVLVVIGIIVGSVLTGKELITQGKLNKLIAQMKENDFAVNQFVTKYNSIPGDFDEATTYFDGADVDDGNANGFIIEETFDFWQQLSLAEMLPATYVGDSSFSITTYIGRNIPKTGYNQDGCISVYTGGMFGGGWPPTFLGGNYNYYFIGARNVPGGIGEGCNTRTFKASDAQRVDQKIDDGKAQDGRLKSDTGSDNIEADTYHIPCYTGSGSSAVYNISINDETCIFRYYFEDADNL